MFSETQQVSGRAGRRPRILASHLALNILSFGPEGQAPCPRLPMQGCGAFSGSQALPHLIPCRYLSHTELAPLRAPLIPMEHCTTRFFETCDLDKDKYIALDEWAGCFGIKERECLSKGAAVLSLPLRCPLCRLCVCPLCPSLLSVPH